MKRIASALVSLTLAFAMCAPALAEETVTATPAVTLQEAQAAYRTAQQNARTADYLAGLQAMVEAGSLTQEQADVLKNAVESRAALQEAQAAYRNAQINSRTAAYAAQLQAMVEAGSLTQEQADVLLAQATATKSTTKSGKTNSSRGRVSIGGKSSKTNSTRSTGGKR